MMELINRHLSLRLHHEFQKSRGAGSDSGAKLEDRIHGIAEQYSLTKRETEVVFKVVKEGMTNSEICESLCIADHTLNKHLINIYRKCDINSRVALIHKVIS